MRVLILILAIAVAGCSAAPPEETVRDPVETVRAIVLSKLRDPASAQFGSLYALPTGIVCGSVNAKNGFGGYTGQRAFWYDPATPELFISPGEDQDLGGKEFDAKSFADHGCPSGLERLVNRDAAGRPRSPESGESPKK